MNQLSRYYPLPVIIHLLYISLGPVDFMERWRSFVTKPADNARPEMIDNSNLLCEHDLFLFDLGNPVDRDNIEGLSIIKEEEWSYLKSL